MVKSIKKTATLAAIALCMVSCKSSYYQVYEVSTDNLKTQDNSLVYENEDCKVLYNLWSLDGELRFAVQNKTDKDIFVNMGQSFYVINGKAVDYYQGRSYTQQEYSQTAAVTTSAFAKRSGYGFWGSDVYVERDVASAVANLQNKTKATSSSVTMKEKEVVCIPAKCYKVFGYYKVSPSFMQTCNKDKDFPNKTCQVGIYSKDNTPIDFKNRIAYGFDKNEVASKHIDNEFWVTIVTNYSKSAATEKSKEKTECYGVKSSKSERVFKIGGPDKFYKYYENDGVSGGYGGF